METLNIYLAGGMQKFGKKDLMKATIGEYILNRN